MATRRPKVPRADALGSPSSGSRPRNVSGPAGTDGDSSAGAEVIAAEFGGHSSSKAPTAGNSAVGSSPAGKSSVSGKPAATNAASTKVGAAKAPGSKAQGSKAADTKAADKGRVSGKPGTSKDDRDLDPVPAKAFSGRMLALAVVMIAITILLAPTVKIFLEKRAEISALEAEIAGRKAEQSELNKQISRWQDPNYVKQQARDRINMVMPGETGYWVFGGEEAAGTPGGRTGSGSSANPENLPWVDALWESIRRSATD